MAILLAFDKAPEEAVKYLESQGIKINWNWKEQKDIIKKRAFTVSKVLSADVLQMVLDNLQKAVKEGDTFEDFKKDLEPKLKNSGYTKKDDGSAWRLKNIYQTNLQTSYNAGRYAQQMEVTEEFPYWELDAIMDSHTTDGCRSVNGVILPASDAFWKTNYPPRHFGCRSKVIAHSKATLKSHGKSLSNPNKYKNEKPAEGFDFLPGEWMPDFNKYSKSVRNKLEKMLNE